MSDGYHFGMLLSERIHLAPSSDIFSQQKANPDENMYTSRFNNEILGILDRGHIVEELEKLGGGNDVVLLCYEKSTDFCHRHLVAKWLSETLDYNVAEWVG